MTHIYPVIHFHDARHALAEAEKIALAGCAGTFLISNAQHEQELVRAAVKVKLAFPKLKVGVNILLMPEDEAMTTILGAHPHIDGLWFDQQVTSNGLTEKQRSVLRTRDMFGGLVFAAVAFKYQPYEADPVTAARVALEAGFIPTTSGSATGQPPKLEKIIAMSEACGGHLAVASGMTPDNIKEYAPYLKYALVATSLVDRNDRIYPERLKELMENAK